MSNIVTIGSSPAADASIAPPLSGAGSQTGVPTQAIQVTENAVKRIRIAMAKEGIAPEQGGLRLGVMGGGCSGRDRVYDFDGVRVFVDPKSFLYLHGMILDYEETLMRQGFNFINPNSTRSCGCGSSFSS
jgi:iron-sulfur cluster assembly protein